MSSSTAESVGIHCASTARLSGDAARVSQRGVLRREASTAPSPDRARRSARRHRRRATPARSARSAPPPRPARGSSRRRAPRARRTVPSDGRRRSSPRARRRSACSSMRPANASARLCVVHGLAAIATTSSRRADSSLPPRAHLRCAVDRRTPTARSSATPAAPRSTSPGAAARSDGSSRCSSSISSASRLAPRSSTPRTSATFLIPYYERVRAELEQLRRNGREVHRRRGHGCLRRADRRTETTRSAPCAPRSPSATGPSTEGLAAAHRREHGRGDRRARRTAPSAARRWSPATS